MFTALIHYEFLLRAALAGIGIALIAGPLGCFIIWRRMAYFGDTLAHASLLGIALGIVMNINLDVAVLFITLAIALIFVLLQQQRQLASDTLLGIMAHGSLASGLVVVAFVEGVRLDLLGYLFGDILAITWQDVITIYAASISLLLVICRYWRPLLAITVHEDLALVEGIPIKATRLLLMLAIAIIIALAMKIVGILLITSLLIIPAATARCFANSPAQMAVLASGIAMIAVIGGLQSSLVWDTPAGPSIVVVAVVMFAASYGLLKRG